MILLFTCPHCQDNFQVDENELNCCIFRHAVLKSTMQQINPHSSKEMCDILFENNLVFGCAKPFQIYKENDEYKIKICDYI